MHPTFARVWSPLALLLVLLRPDPIVPPLQALDRTRAADLRQGYDEYAARRRISPSAFLSWSHLGPTNLSGRSTDVAVAEVDGRRRIYVGYATSGVWRSDDNGTTWRAVFENEASTSIGDLAVAPSRPDTIWVGTGESNIYRASMPGVGVYKSTDGGLHWQHMGLDDTQTIARIVVHPSNPDVVYVAASGHEWTDNDARGVYKTTDGGRTWTRVLFASPRTGAIDLVMDPRDPDTLYAALWQRIRRKWSDPRVEPGYRESAVVKTTDGGRTWTDASHGLPAPADRGRIGLDISRSHPDTLYAFVDNYHVRRRANPGERDVYGRSIAPGQGLLTGADVYRSDDAGRTWRRTSRADAATRRTLDHQSETFGWVFGQIRVDPTDADVVYILGVPLSVSHDGGRSFTEIEGPTRSNVDGRPTGRLHHDHHGLWIDPDDPAVLYDCNDGGFYTSSDAGRTWDYAVSAGGVEFYDVALDTSTPAWAYGFDPGSGQLARSRHAGAGGVRVRGRGLPGGPRRRGVPTRHRSRSSRRRVRGRVLRHFRAHRSRRRASRGHRHPATRHRPSRGMAGANHRLAARPTDDLRGLSVRLPITHAR